MIGLLVAAAVVCIVREIRASDGCPVAHPIPSPDRSLVGVSAFVLALAGVSLSTTAELVLPRVGGPVCAAVGVLVVAVHVRRVVRRARSTGDARTPPPLVPAACSTSRGGPPIPRVLLVLATVAILAAGYVVVRRVVRSPDGEWDAFSIWNLRARLLVRLPGEPGLIFRSEVSGAHPDYPLHLPGLVATGLRALGDRSTLPSAIVAVLFLAATGAGLYGAVAPRRGRAAGVLALLALLAAPHVLKQTALRFADLPLATSLLLACGWLAAAHESPERARSSLVLVGALGSLAAWTKNEGIVHLLVLGLVTLAKPPASIGRGRALGRLALGAAPLLAVLVAFKVGLAPANDLVAGTTAASALARAADASRYLMIAKAWLADVGTMSHWNLLIPVALVVALVGRARAGAVVGLVVLGVGAAYAAVYVLTPHDLAWHLETSLERLELHVYPSLLLCAFLSARIPARFRRPTGGPGDAPPADVSLSRRPHPSDPA